jgi:transcriptional regulator with XRE-family HTH domain
MKQLIRLRKSKGLTQFELGNAIGIDANSIARYEQGKVRPSIDSAQRLAEFFNVSIDELLNGPQPNEIQVRILITTTNMRICRTIRSGFHNPV